MNSTKFGQMVNITLWAGIAAIVGGVVLLVTTRKS